MSKQNILILFGGQSAEHEISLCSAWNVISNLDHDKYELICVGIDKQGQWFLQNEQKFLMQEPFAGSIQLLYSDQQIAVVPGLEKDQLFNFGSKETIHIDVAIPMLHGPMGEDGTIQGLLEHLNIPYVGPDVLSASVCMDKDVAKRLMQQAKIPTSDFMTFNKSDDLQIRYDKVIEKLGSPIFIKPANMGSSVGINKVEQESEFREAVELAFEHDEKIIIEQFVDGMEVECAVLGNDSLKVSFPGRYTHSDSFFAYDTKYLKGNEVGMEIPVEQLSNELIESIRAISLKAYRVLECKGMARVDTFVTKEGAFLVNEVNTIPGFTNTSMYPLLMKHLGMSYSELLDRLIELAQE